MRNPYPKVLAPTFFSSTSIILLIIVFTFIACEKPVRDNPWDYFADLNPDTWAPTNLEIEPVTITSKRLTWQYNDDDRIEGFKLDKKTGDATWQIGIKVFDKEIREWLDEDIVPDTTLTYHYRLYAIAGDNSSTAVTSFSGIEFPAPTDFTIEKKTDVSYELKWTIPFTGEQGIKIDRRVGQNDWELAFAQLEAGQTSFLDTNVFLPKTSAVLVAYRVYGYHGDYHSAKAYGYTDAALPAPLNLAAAVQSDTSVETSWEYEISGHQGFKIDRQRDNEAWEIAFVTTNSDETSYMDNTVDFKEHGYHYRVYVYYDDYESPKSEVYIARPMVTTTPVTNPSYNSATGGGNVTSSGSANVTTRGIAYAKSQNPTITDNIVSVGSGTGSFTGNMTGLEPGTTYYVRAYATNNAGTAYGSQVSFTTFGPCYGVTPPSGYGVVESSGKCWLDRNLGASRVAQSSTDAQAYGHLFQWGRAADGHQLRTSGTTTTLSNSDTPGHGNFILAPNSPRDWRSPQNTNLWQGVNGINNPCPTGYRLPTEAELNAEQLSWSSNNSAGAFASPLKLPVAGYRLYSNGSLNIVGYGASYWSSTVGGTYSRYLYFASSGATMGSYDRASGNSVRCLKD